MKNFIKAVCLCFLAITGVFLFQGQDANQTSGDNTISDRWRNINYQDNTGYTPPPQPMVVVTTIDGYDNWDMGIDNAESSIAVHPNNPTWFANGWNGNPLGVAGTHHTETGHETWLINNPALPSTAGDPWMAYDSLGNLYYINLNGSVNGTWVVKSTNNGLTWGAAV